MNSDILEKIEVIRFILGGNEFLFEDNFPTLLNVSRIPALNKLAISSSFLVLELNLRLLQSASCT